MGVLQGGESGFRAVQSRLNPGGAGEGHGPASGLSILGSGQSDLVTASSQSHAKPTLHHSRLSKSRRGTSSQGCRSEEDTARATGEEKGMKTSPAYVGGPA